MPSVYEIGSNTKGDELLFHQNSLKMMAALCLSALATPGVIFAQRAQGHAVLMISIDGLRPDAILQAEQHHLQIPVLRQFLRNGSYAKEVVNVNPTLTYPNHTTLVTGVSPAEHGIYNNTLFDPTGKEQGAWYWYAPMIQSPTLWDAARAKGLTSGSVRWPATVNARSITYNVPDYWRSSSEVDRYLLDAVSTPSGILHELEEKAESLQEGLTDENITRISVGLMRAKHPDLMTVHLVELDHQEHLHGPFSPEANATLEIIDRQVERLKKAELEAHLDADIVIVSDHGFLPVKHSVNLNRALVQAGLITLGEGTPAHVTSWKAYAWDGGGSAAIRIHDKDDRATIKAVGELLAGFEADSANGVRKVLTRDQAIAAGESPDVFFVVDWKSGYYFGGALTGPVVSDAKLGGMHGYMNDTPQLHSVFLIEGPDIAQGKDLGVIDMRQIAPTIAHEMQIDLPSAGMTPLPVNLPQQ
jgi:predicted AlkP superfamily pyrophosphatase or phosphodiesterase